MTEENGNEEAMREALEMVAPAAFVGAVFRVMDMVQIAIEEIDSAAKRYPLRKDLLGDAFPLLRPPKMMSQLDDTVYRHHCRELLDRIGKSNSSTITTHATDAELLTELSLGTLKVMPSHDAAVVFFNVFHKIFEGNPLRIDQRERPRETYPGSAGEVEHKLRQHLHNPERRMK